MFRILNCYQRATSLLASQFRNEKIDGSLTNLQKLLRALITPAQEVQDVLYQLSSQRWLDTAVGVQLDEIGIILGIPREINESDEDYRTRLKFQIFINGSSGTPEQLISIAKFFNNSTNLVYFEVYPAAFQIIINGVQFPNPPSLLAENIQKASPAGVLFIGLTSTYGTLPFGFSSDVLLQPLYVSPNPLNSSEINPLEVTDGIGDYILNVQSGLINSPTESRGFAEAIGTYPVYTIDTTNAGQLAELIVG